MARARDVMARSRLRRLIVAGASSMCVASAKASAQTPATSRQSSVQPEARVDFIDARAAAAHIGVGFSVPAGTYVRLGLVGAAGQSWHHGESSGAGRVDALVRFVVDPLREFRWAPYVAGGVGGIYDRSEAWRAVLVGALGIEGPASGSIVPAIEIGFGGGARVGVAIRRAMPGRR